MAKKTMREMLAEWGNTKDKKPAVKLDRVPKKKKKPNRGLLGRAMDARKNRDKYIQDAVKKALKK